MTRHRNWELTITEARGGLVYADFYKDGSLVASGLGTDEPEAILKAAEQMNGVGRPSALEHPQEIA